MATIYEVKYLCVACGYRWGVETRDKLRDFHRRKCRECKRELAKVIYLGPKPKQ